MWFCQSFWVISLLLILFRISAEFHIPVLCVSWRVLVRVLRIRWPSPERPEAFPSAPSALNENAGVKKILQLSLCSEKDAPHNACDRVTMGSPKNIHTEQNGLVVASSILRACFCLWAATWPLQIRLKLGKRAKEREKEAVQTINHSKSGLYVLP